MPGKLPGDNLIQFELVGEINDEVADPGYNIRMLAWALRRFGRSDVRSVLSPTQDVHVFHGDSRICRRTSHHWHWYTGGASNSTRNTPGNGKLLCINRQLDT